MKNVTWNYLNHNFDTGTRGNNSRLAAQPGLGLWTQRCSWAGGDYYFDPVINRKIIVNYLNNPKSTRRNDINPDVAEQ
jgi:hypothetical protein